VDVHLFVVVLYTRTDPLILVVVSTSAILETDSTTAGLAKLVEELSTYVPSDTATVNASSGVTTAVISAMLYLSNLRIHCNYPFNHSSFCTRRRSDLDIVQPSSRRNGFRLCIC